MWVVGPTLDLAEKEFRVAWKICVTNRAIPVRRKSERELFIEFVNGSFIECRSEENPDQLIGEGLDLAIMAEAARLKFRTWDQYVRPALADKQGAALFTSTPRGFNYFHEFYNRGQDPTQQDWESWMIPSRMNPILPQSEIDEARRNSTPEAFAQEWEAKFIHYSGLVFPEFDETIHVRPLYYQQLLRTALWVDPGASAPYAVLLVQITPDQKVFVLDEIYRTGRVTDQIISEATEKWPFLLNDYGNPDVNVEVIIDQAAAEAAAVWRSKGWRAGGLKPKIKQGIEVHHRFLRDPLESVLGWPMGTYGADDPGRPDTVVPRILFDPKCRNVIREHGSYHYPDDARKRIETNKTELPVDIDNHTIDALRYGYFNTWPELFNIQLPSEQVVTSTLEEMGFDISSRRMESAYSDGSSLLDSYYSGPERRGAISDNY